MKSNMEAINNTFKLPIYYNKKKRELNANIITDLELDKTIEKDGDPMYKFAFQPKTCFGKVVMEQFSNHYTTDVKYLKDTQKILKSYKKLDHEIFRPDFDRIQEIWDEIKNDTGFKSKYQYIDWSYWEYLNKSELFLQVMSLYNLASPIISFFIPIIILIIPFFIIQMRGVVLSIDQYIEVLKTIASNHAIGKLFTQFGSVSMNEKIYMLISAGFYIFSIYQNILMCYRFYNNMQKIHIYLTDIKNYIEYTSKSINNFLLYSTPYNSYAEFNDKLRDTEKKLSQYKIELDKITHFELSLTKSMQFGHILKTFYELYDDVNYNDGFLHSFGFNGFIDNIEGVISNIREKKMNTACFIEGKKGKKGKKGENEKTNKKNTKNKNNESRDTCKIKKGYYPSHIHDAPILNDIDLLKNNIITGPNASGKTTTLKTFLINIILSQQIGCGFYSDAEFRPFDNIHCYLNIPDTSGRDSLFQAEARRCKDIIDSIHANNNETHICVFDELYSGTNPEEAVESAGAFMEYLTKYKGVYSMLTTHFIELCKNLEKDENFLNYHMKIKNNPNEGFTYTYLLAPGISTIKGGFKVLQDMNFPEEIIKKKSKIQL